ncbi:MAG: extracellular solute-binding protein [Eubacterium sp.]|nr:extracellular solute-binding protein [Eubacterium sp.]
MNTKTSMLKRLVSVLFVIIFLLSLCAGCQTSNDQIQTLEKKENVQLDIWVFFDMNEPGNHYVDLWDELAEKYGYDVNVKFYSTEQIKGKLRVALVCKEMPDIFLVWGGTYPDYLIDAGECIPVQEYLQASDIDYKESYVMPYKDGNNYIIPCLVEAYAVTYYNQELIDKMELTVPTTWDELLQLVQDVNDYNISHATRYAAINLGEKDAWLGELLYCMIVNRMDPYAYDKLKSGEIAFSDPIFIEAANRVRQLVDSHAFPSGFMEIGEVEAVENFIDGEAVLFPHQSTIVYYLLENMSEGSFHTMQFPSCNDEYNDIYSTYMMDINHTLTPGLCVSSRSEYPEEAVKICLDFAKTVNEINVSEYGYLNITNDEIAVPEDLEEPIVEFRQMIEEAEKMTAYWYAELPQEAANNWRNLTKKLYAGEVDVETFIQEGEQYLQFEK